ncbi:MAG: major capsid protein [Microviridae sp.]|nr:MAG: major capsid protein [Microviridae sp.]
MARTQHQYSQTKTADIPRSSFDLSHGLKTTLESSQLVPILSLEVLPGDTINCKASLFGRLATPIKPFMDNVFMETFFFFTPWRQVWPNFTKMMGEQDAPGDSIEYSVPIISGGNGNVTEQSISDYLGIPIGATLNAGILPVNALPFRCYNKIFNYWFRDENLVAPVPEITSDGPDNLANNYSIKSRRKRRDYITSSLPFPQKGPDVTIDFAITGNVITDAPDGTVVTIDDSTTGLPHSLNAQINPAQVQKGTQEGTANSPLYIDGGESAITINSLRESFQIQKLLERDARGGTRYPEILQSHFRVNDPSLLVHQRPLYLGGGSSMVNINPVQQSSGTAEPDGYTPTPQGNLSAYGTVSGRNHGFTASFTEHGHVMGIVNFRADLTYQQGLERYWTRQTRYDFYWPALSHLGEQATKNSEVFVSNNIAIDNDTFGYMPRYDEYRSKQSQITGLFRSDATASLDVWHLAQDFTALPALDEAFITDAVPMDRVVAVPSEPDWLLDVYFKIRAARPLPLYATPGLIDHF